MTEQNKSDDERKVPSPGSGGESSQNAPQKTDEEWAKEIEDDLRTNERYKPFFNRYRPSLLNESFMKFYAEEKVRVLQRGKKCVENAERELLSIAGKGAECLWQIQQRKLFDLQCQWRAGNIELPDIRICMDFQYWGELIQHCPFLPPITQEEFDLYHGYMLSDEFDEERLGWNWLWQDYDGLKMQLKEGDEGEDYEYLPWYEYYEAFKGGHDWFLLPDIRGEEEEKYMDLLHPPGPVPEERKDARPYISPYHGQDRDIFRKMFESAEYNRLYDAYDRESDWIEMEERLREAVWDLLEFEGPFPIEYNDDWKEGIFRAAKRANRLRLAKACEAAYEEYKTREALGLKHELLLDEEKIATEEERRKFFRDKIRQGMILNGEKPDF
ncbi:MAG: hypothetical protein M1339_06005 [Bacteroidetes bacterium]|nr:hypothetical protein [Bacteroidota bacterium]